MTSKASASTNGRAGLSATPRLPPGETPDGSRGRVLLASLELFARRGFFGTSIRDISAAVGMTSASLYSHFGSKDEILAELLRIGHAYHLDQLEQALSVAGDDPVARLEAVVRAHVRVHADYPLMGVVANSELHALPDDQVAAAAALRRKSEAVVLGVVEEGVRAGVFDVPSPFLALAAIGAMGLRVANWFDTSVRVGADEVADAYALFAVRLVGAS